jgi:hypothetical protein
MADVVVGPEDLRWVPQLRTYSGAVIAADVKVLRCVHLRTGRKAARAGRGQRRRDHE